MAGYVKRKSSGAESKPEEQKLPSEDEIVAARNAILGAVAESFLQGDYSDITVHCGRFDFQAHKSVLCNRSPFFAAAFKIPLKEKETGIISFDSDPPAVVYSMLEFCYNGDFSSAPVQYLNDAGEFNAAAHFVQVYEFANRLGLTELKALSASKLKHHFAALKKPVTLPDNAFYQTVYEASQPTDGMLRDVVVQFTIANVDRNIRENADFAALLIELPEFSRDLVFAYLPPTISSPCPNCFSTARGKDYYGQVVCVGCRRRNFSI